MSSSSKEIGFEDLKSLIDFMSKSVYRAKDDHPKNNEIMKNCLDLFSKDYKYSVINNSNGDLCNHYPAQLIILEYAMDREQNPENAQQMESLYDMTKLKELFTKARFARCRSRFVIPSIMYEGKHICRSGTISGGAEIYGRSGFDLFFTGGESIPDEEASSQRDSSSEWQLFNRIRGQDIKLLRTLQVTHICDLMVENKKVKFGMNITSSEKVDKEKRYSDFKIIALPYPGCEFFKAWKANNYAADNMTFDWKQSYIDAQLDIPTETVNPEISALDWHNYRNWDLIKMTQNYMKLLLHYIREGCSGINIHCISGWDRTPLFITLVRLSLWADKAAHTSLNAMEILYLTIAYDWYLFGHNLPDRLGKGEDIFFFTFYFLRYMQSEEYSVKPNQTPRRRATSRTDSECNTEGVLLDSDMTIRRCSYCGSNTSLNSSCSGTSNRSSVTDMAPQYFHVGSPEEETFIQHGSTSAHSVAYHRRSPNSMSKKPSNPDLASHTRQYSSSPVAVPNNLRARNDSGSSLNCGSWQVISGSGSLRGSTTFRDSPHSSASDHNSAASHTSSCSEAGEVHEYCSQRMHRLDEARRHFHHAYGITVGFGNTDNKAITSVLDHFAEKVGIRQGKAGAT